jgi:hypothetical protein
LAFTVDPISWPASFALTAVFTHLHEEVRVAKTDFKTIEDYIASLTDGNKAGVRAICDAIVRAVLSCPPPFPSFEAFEAELARYAKTKSALKLPKKKPLPPNWSCRTRS